MTKHEQMYSVLTAWHDESQTLKITATLQMLIHIRSPVSGITLITIQSTHKTHNINMMTPIVLPPCTWPSCYSITYMGSVCQVLL
jgi:hypothetical protein